MKNDWTDIEVELIVADYFSMLLDELKGIPINKTDHRKTLLMFIKRSPASIEFKHRNISAELILMGLPFIKGYKPLYNSQKTLLVDKIKVYISSHYLVTKIFNDFVESAKSVVQYPEFTSWIVEKPEMTKVILKEPTETYRRPFKVNYLEREQMNRDLGMKGEELVLRFEKWNLMQAGKENLADSIEWVSRDLGDGLGFDILSKNVNGTDKYIEVKTTKLSKETPFFFTSSELKFSIEKASEFHLYRLFDFNQVPKMFQLEGRYDNFCKVEPIQYKGWF